MENKKNVQVKQKLNLYNYIAGFFDGEGTILITRRYDNNRGCRYYLSVRIANTCLEILNDCMLVWGGYIYTVKKAQTHHKQAYCWYINNAKAEIFLNDIFPFLRVKKDEAKIALLFRKKQIELNKERLLRSRVGGTNNGYNAGDYKLLAGYREMLFDKRNPAINRRRRDEKGSFPETRQA